MNGDHSMITIIRVYMNHGDTHNVSWPFHFYHRNISRMCLTTSAERLVHNLLLGDLKHNQHYICFRKSNLYCCDVFHSEYCYTKKLPNRFWEINISSNNRIYACIIMDIRYEKSFDNVTQFAVLLELKTIIILELISILVNISYELGKIGGSVQKKVQSEATNLIRFYIVLNWEEKWFLPSKKQT